MLAAKTAPIVKPLEDQHGESTTLGTAAGTDSDQRVESGVQSAEIVADKADSPDGIPSAVEPAQQASVSKPAGLRLNTLKFGGIPVGGANAGSKAAATPRIDPVVRDSVPSNGAGEPDRRVQSSGADGNPAASKPTSLAGLSLADIAGFTGELNEVDPGAEDDVPLDHIPANAPERVLPEAMTPQMTQFVKSLDSIYHLHTEPEMFVDMVRRIMSDMQDNPNLVSLLADDDSFTMITGLRQQAGMAQVRKVESKAKRGSSGAKSVAKTSSAMDSVADALAAFSQISTD